MSRARVTESRDIHHPDFILSQRPSATTRQLRYITRAEFMTPQSERIREACNVKTGEMILCGGANSGKTMILLNKLYFMHCQNPNLLSVIIRKSKEDLRPTVLNQWDRKVMPFGYNDPRNPCQGHGGKHNTSAYYWKNGGITFLMGAQDARRFKGTEFDVVLISQAEELAQDDFELIAHRVDGRAGNYILNGQKIGHVMADCNPDVANHWIPYIAKEGRCKLINVTLRDNMENFRDGRRPRTFAVKTEAWRGTGPRPTIQGSGLDSHKRKRLFRSYRPKEAFYRYKPNMHRDREVSPTLLIVKIVKIL